MGETKNIKQQKTDRLYSESTEHIGTEQPVSMEKPLDSISKGTVIAERYRVIDEMPAHGGEADVFRCLDCKTNRQVAVKIYRANLHPNQDLLDAVLRLKHDNLVKLLDFGEWKRRSMEIMEYVEGGTLEKHMPYTEDELVNKIIPQVLSAIEYLHVNNIIHKDLKPTNLFFDNKARDKVLVGDYGIASLVIGPQSLHYSSSGKRTVQFTAPERFSGYFGYEVDYYSLGISLIWFIKGEDPFAGMEEPQIIYSHLLPQEHTIIPNNCSENLKILIRGLLHKNRELRWGNEEIKRWLHGEAVPVPSYEISSDSTQSFRYKLDYNLIAANPEELGKMMLDNPEVSKRHIRNRPFFDTFNLYDQALASKLHDIRESARSIEEAFIEIVYTLNPELPYKLMEGYEARNPQELAKLIDKDQNTWEAGKKQLYNGSILAWLRAIGYEGIADEWDKVADKYSSSG